MSEIQPAETVAEITPTEVPAAPKADALPDDHPLVKTLAAQKNELKELREKARRLDEFEDSQKSEAQRLADAAADSKRDADEARAEATRYKVAATHGVSADYFDLLGSGDEGTISARAERVSALLKSASEVEQLRAEVEALRTGKPSPTSIRPVASLKPGATPENAPTEQDAIYQSLFGTN